MEKQIVERFWARLFGPSAQQVDGGTNAPQPNQETSVRAASETVERLIATLTERQRERSEAEAEIAAAEAGLREKQNEIQSLVQAVNEKERAIAQSGGDFPTELFPEETEIKLQKRQLRILEHRLQLPRERLQSITDKIATLGTEVDRAWSDHGKAEWAAAVERFELAAQAMVWCYRDLLGVEQTFQNPQAHVVSMWVPEVIIGGGKDGGRLFHHDEFRTDPSKRQSCPSLLVLSETRGRIREAKQ